MHHVVKTDPVPKARVEKVALIAMVGKAAGEAKAEAAMVRAVAVEKAVAKVTKHLRLARDLPLFI